MKKVVSVIGARPQFIKAAAVSRAFKAAGRIEEIIIHTGQHYDSNMSDIFFSQMEIPKPNYHLGIGGGTHGEMTGRQLEEIEKVLIKEKPDWVLVYGDTNSTLAGALAASKLHIPVVHVEAGLRSFNRRMPEEINRVLTDHLSSLLLAPTAISQENLNKEGIPDEKIHVVGDVMYDAALFYKKKAVKPQWFDELKIDLGQYVLCTIHRAENTDDPQRLKSILAGLGESELPILLPLHPRTKGKLLELDIALPENIYVVDPVGYLEMVWLEVYSKCIATDSGGVQKEAYFHGKHCITLRDETEWKELVEEGVNTLVGADSNAISEAINNSVLLTSTKPLYGSGDTSRKIADVLGATG